MDYINAFWVGGLICALVQILMEKTKMLPGRIMVLLVCLGAVLGALQIYQPFIEFAGAGASDYENAVKRFAGNEALYEKFLKKLTEDDHLAIGEQAMKEERYEDVLEAVHALKGVAGTLGMTELFQAASEVVASIRKNEISHLQEQMAKVHTEFEKACEAVS